MQESPDFIAKLEKQLVLHEGKRLVAYLCSGGFLTGGIGHNFDAAPIAGVSKVGDTITEQLCAELFKADVQKCINDVHNYMPWVAALTDARRAVMYDLCFNMGIGKPPREGKKGSGLRSFVNTLKAIEQGNYTKGAQGLLQSKYAKTVGKRAHRLAEQLISDIWCF